MYFRENYKKRKEGLVMKKIIVQLVAVLAMLVFVIASNSAGLPSEWGWYQPKVPEKLCK